MRCFPVQAFSGPVVHLIDDECDLFKSHLQQIGSLGEILLDEAVVQRNCAATVAVRLKQGLDDSRHALCVFTFDQTRKGVARRSVSQRDHPPL